MPKHVDDMQRSPAERLAEQQARDMVDEAVQELMQPAFEAYVNGCEGVCVLAKAGFRAALRVAYEAGVASAPA